MATLRDKMLEYIRSNYDVDDTRANAILTQLTSAANGFRGNFYAQHLNDQVTNKGDSPANQDRYSTQNEQWVDTAAGQLGIPKKSATPQEKQKNEAAAAQNQVSAVAQQAADQAKGGDVQGATSVLQQFMQSLGSSGQVPSQVLQLTGGRQLTPAQIQAAISHYNSLNPSDQLAPNDADGFYQRVAFGAPGAVESLGMSVEGEDLGFTTFKYWDPRQTPTSLQMGEKKVDSNQIFSAVQAFPAAASSLGSIVAASARTDGEVPWQLIISATRLTGQKASDLGKTITIGRNEVLGPNADRRVQFSDSTARELRDRIRQYNDYGLALISLKDPNLANSIYEQGGVNSDQAKQVSQIFLDAGFDPKTMAAQGLAIDTTKFQAATDPTAGPGGAQMKVQLPDPAKLQEAARTLYQAWFVREPTDTELNGFVQAIDQQVIAKTQSNAGNVFKGIQPTEQNVMTDVDPQSQLQQQLRSSSEYHQLFGNKPIGTSEEDYAGQFKQVGASLLGGQIPDSEAVRLGMMEGNPQATIGYVSGKKSSADNSTFMERMALAANAIAQVT